MTSRRLTLALLFAPLLSAQSPAALNVGGQYAVPFESWLTRQAEQLWDQREQSLQRLTTADQIRDRQTYLRQVMLDAIGGLPTSKTPLHARVTGSFAREGYRVENITFESQPGFLVTANLYLPTTGRAPYPAVLGVAGHSVNGKASATYQAAFIGFAKQGFAVLAYDPPGQGERLEYLDVDTGRSRPGVGVAEHNMAGLQTLLTGQTLARYFIWDGVRAFDYLLTRPEIDPQRIAVAGNSGGGTQASYLAVFEPRLAAVVASCYITRWRELWSGPGPQDAEQIFPRFLEKGLDFGDFALAHAPRPFLMTTAIRDFFPIDGARATFKQNQRLFDMLGGGERAGYFEYDDTHGWSQPRREAASRFLAKHLQGRDIDGREPALLPEEESLLYATPTGQIATAGGRETVRTLNLAEARRLAALRPPVTLASVQAALGWKGLPPLPPARKVNEETRDGIRIEKLELTVEGGVPIPALLFHPAIVRRTIVYANAAGKFADPDLFALVRAGALVLAVDPRAAGESYQAPARSGYRQDYQLAARAMLLGRNLVEMQAADLIAAAQYLQSRPEAANRAPALYVKGALGPAAHFAAALHPGIAELVLERSIVSYQHLAEAPLHEGLNTVVVPGILRRVDLPAVLPLIAPRPVTHISPLYPNGRRLLKSEVDLPGAQVLLRGEGWSLERTLPQWFVQ
jgi:hypothetical protein